MRTFRLYGTDESSEFCAFLLGARSFIPQKSRPGGPLHTPIALVDSFRSW